AGARDFLPLPTESGPEPTSPEPTVAQPVVKPAAVAATAPVAPVQVNPVEPKPAPLPVAPAPRANITPIVQAEPTEEQWSSRFKDEHNDPEIAQVIEEITLPSAPAVPESGPSEFAEWDAANLRRAQAPPTAAKKAESR